MNSLVDEVEYSVTFDFLKSLYTTFVDKNQPN